MLIYHNCIFHTTTIKVVYNLIYTFDNELRAEKIKQDKNIINKIYSTEVFSDDKQPVTNKGWSENLTDKEKSFIEKRLDHESRLAIQERIAIENRIQFNKESVKSNMIATSKLQEEIEC